jgi:hypothetical protein
MDLSHITLNTPLPNCPDLAAPPKPIRNTDPHRRSRKQQTRPSHYIIRHHRDGTVELIICSRGGPLRFFSASEDECFTNATKFLSSYGR